MPLNFSCEGLEKLTVPHDKLATNNTTIGIGLAGLLLPILLLLRDATNRLLGSSGTLIIAICIGTFFSLELYIGLLVIMSIGKESLATCIMVNDGFIIL